MSGNANASLEKVLERFKSRDIPAVIAECVQLRIPASWPASQWNLANRALAYAQTGTLSVRGFHQWQEVGRRVQKGAKAVYIWAPWICTKIDEKTGEKKRFLRGFIPIAVFPEAATEGDPLTETFEPAELPPLYDVAERFGVTVFYTPTPDDRLADFQPGQINLGTTDPHVFWHELAHAAHHQVEAEFHVLDQGYKETVAEFTACVLASLYGQDYFGMSYRYLEMFSGDDPLRAVMRAMGDIEKVISLIMSVSTEVDYAH